MFDIKLEFCDVIITIKKELNVVEKENINSWCKFRRERLSRNNGM